MSSNPPLAYKFLTEVNKQSLLKRSLLSDTYEWYFFITVSVVWLQVGAVGGSRDQLECGGRGFMVVLRYILLQRLVQYL